MCLVINRTLDSRSKLNRNRDFKKYQKILIILKLNFSFKESLSSNYIFNGLSIK
jgi:hypothetical protein